MQLYCNQKSPKATESNNSPIVLERKNRIRDGRLSAYQEEKINQKH